MLRLPQPFGSSWANRRCKYDGRAGDAGNLPLLPLHGGSRLPAAYGRALLLVRSGADHLHQPGLHLRIFLRAQPCSRRGLANAAAQTYAGGDPSAQAAGEAGEAARLQGAAERTCRVITTIPDGLRICETCGDLAAGELCPTCEELASRYDARYHAHLAARLFAQQQRNVVPDDDLSWDGLGAARGLYVVCRVWVAIGAAAFVCYLALQWRWPL